MNQQSSKVLDILKEQDSVTSKKTAATTVLKCEARSCVNWSGSAPSGCLLGTISIMENGFCDNYRLKNVIQRSTQYA